jgi:hypothetical protein
MAVLVNPTRFQAVQRITLEEAAVDTDMPQGRHQRLVELEESAAAVGVQATRLRRSQEQQTPEAAAAVDRSRSLVESTPID